MVNHPVYLICFSEQTIQTSIYIVSSHLLPSNSHNTPVVPQLDHKLMEFSFHLVGRSASNLYIVYTHYIILYYTGNLGESYGVDPTGCALVAFETKFSMLFLNLLRTFNLHLSVRINNI